MGATLVTGASGFLGSQIAEALAGTGRRLVLPLRPGARTTATGDVTELGAEQPPFDEIVHSAGCVDYFDERALQEANVDLTAHLLDLGRRRGIDRFVYVSTAYSSGYLPGVVPERLHPDPPAGAEPTPYTRSKRTAERLVATSGLPYLIVRPSVVIGDSRTGAYGGKNYGLYQMWRAVEGLLCREDTPVWHTVAPAVPVNLIHQDTFRAAFLAAYRRPGAKRITHLVGDDAGPTMRDLALLWSGERQIRLYDSLDDVPMAELPRRQRRFLELTHKNIEIACHRWRFEAENPAPVTLEAVERCRRRFLSRS